MLHATSATPTGTATNNWLLAADCRGLNPRTRCCTELLRTGYGVTRWRLVWSGARLCHARVATSSKTCMVQGAGHTRRRRRSVPRTHTHRHTHTARLLRSSGGHTPPPSRACGAVCTMDGLAEHAYRALSDSFPPSTAARSLTHRRHDHQNHKTDILGAPATAAAPPHALRLPQLLSPRRRMPRACYEGGGLWANKPTL